MKEALRDPNLDPAAREQLVIQYRAAFMRDLRGLIAAWGDIRKEQVNRLLEESDNNIKLVITNIIGEMTPHGRDEILPDPGRRTTESYPTTAR